MHNQLNSNNTSSQSPVEKNVDVMLKEVSYQEMNGANLDLHDIKVICAKIAENQKQKEQEDKGSEKVWGFKF